VSDCHIVCRGSDVFVMGPHAQCVCGAALRVNVIHELVLVVDAA
jgi:hypothetical protein